MIKYVDDIAKLDRYRHILTNIIEKYRDTRNKLYIHQEARIWHMVHKEYPGVVMLDGHYKEGII